MYEFERRTSTETIRQPHFHLTDEVCEDTLVWVATVAVTVATKGKTGSTARATKAGTVTQGVGEGTEAVTGNWVTSGMSLVWLRGLWGCGMSVRAVIPGDASDAVASYPIADTNSDPLQGLHPLGLLV